MRDFRYCPFCGEVLNRPTRMDRPRCASCGFVHHLNPIAVVAGVLLSDRDDLPPVGTIIDHERATHLLLVRRTGTHRGSWCIPCGYGEYDESAQETAIREMREETGLVVAIERVLAVHSNFHDRDRQTVGTWFLVRYLGGELRAGDDADRAQFFPLAGISVPLAFPTDEKVIAQLR